MSKRSIIHNTREELITEAEVVTRWSKKRIAIAAVLALVLIVAGIYGVGAFAGKAKQVLGVKNSVNKPEIQIPDQQTVKKVIDDAKQSLSNINPQNIVASQPEIQKVINNLEGIVSSSTSAKSLICDTLCK